MNDLLISKAASSSSKMSQSRSLVVIRRYSWKPVVVAGALHLHTMNYANVYMESNGELTSFYTCFQVKPSRLQLRAHKAMAWPKRSITCCMPPVSEV